MSDTLRGGFFGLTLYIEYGNVYKVREKRDANRRLHVRNFRGERCPSDAHFLQGGDGPPLFDKTRPYIMSRITVKSMYLQMRSTQTNGTSRLMFKAITIWSVLPVPPYVRF